MAWFVRWGTPDFGRCNSGVVGGHDTMFSVPFVLKTKTCHAVPSEIRVCLRPFCLPNSLSEWFDFPGHEHVLAGYTVDAV